MVTSTNTTEIRREIRELEKNATSLMATIRSLETDIDEHDKLADITISEYVEEQKETQTVEINRKYKVPIDKLTSEIDELEELIALRVTDEESEELIKAREKQAYLDKAAIMLARARQALEKASHPHFFWLGYNQRKLSMSKYRKLYAVIEKRIEDIEEWNQYTARPFSVIEEREVEKGINKVNYLYSVLLSPYILANTVPVLLTVIRRNSELHRYSQFYHTLMFNTIRIREANAEQIEKLFGDLIDIRQKSLNEELDILRDKLDKEESSRDDELNNIEIDTSSQILLEQDKLGKSKVDLEANKNSLSELEVTIKEMKATLDKLTSDYSDSLEVERAPYIEGTDDKSIVLPTGILFDYSTGLNKFVTLQSGLYLFEEREDTFEYMRLIIFELRNYLRWGTYSFKVHDLLSATELLDLMMPDTNNSDITVYSLTSEKEQLIETMHDLYSRRLKQLAGVAEDVDEFNILAEEKESSLIQYNFLFLYSESKLQLDEQMIQLLALGRKVGIVVLLFVAREQIDTRILKPYVSFIPKTIELTNSGITEHDTKEFIYELEFEESD